jgi:hypothetical protein
MPLVFGSIFGWLTFGLVIAAVQHRIVREEPHLRQIFGPPYDDYASRTARLVRRVLVRGSSWRAATGPAAVWISALIEPEVLRALPPTPRAGRVEPARL